MVTLDRNNLEESLKEARKRMNDFGNKIDVIINPFINKTLSKKEEIELCHIGKFIVVFDDSVRLIEKREAPDSIIQYQSELIGLEVERVFNLEEVEEIKSKQSLFESAAKEFESQHSEIKILGNFWLIDGFQLKGNSKKSLIREINNFVFATVSNNNPIRPAFIKNADFMSHSGISFNFNEGAYSAEDITETTLNEAIQKKELKFNKYKENSGIERQWLLLVSGEGSDSFNIEDFELSKEIESNFEHIYLLEDFDAKVIKIK